MEIENFARITERIILKNGFDDFLPTLCLPEQKHVAVLEGIPEKDQSGIRSISLAWAKDKAGAQDEFLLAFKESAETFRIIRKFRGKISEGTFPAPKSP